MYYACNKKSWCKIGQYIKFKKDSSNFLILNGGISHYFLHEIYPDLKLSIGRIIGFSKTRIMVEFDCALKEKLHDGTDVGFGEGFRGKKDSCRWFCLEELESAFVPIRGSSIELFYDFIESDFDIFERL